MQVELRKYIKLLLSVSILMAGTGCQNYVVDVSNSKLYASMINQCFVATKTLKIVKHEKDQRIIELSPGNSGPGLVQMGEIVPGTKIILRQVERQHVVAYGDLYVGIVEFSFQGEPIKAEAFSIFQTKQGFEYNPHWLLPCN